MNTSSRQAIVIGAGIVGLAAARAFALNGYRVKVLERSSFAAGASVRNFGMVWPIGQPLGHLYERALRSRHIWAGICKDAGIWHSPQGSMHVAYHKDELDVLQEFTDLNEGVRPCRMMLPDDVLAKAPGVNPEGLLGGLFSEDELIVDPREAIARLPAYLSEKYGVEFLFETPVTAISHPKVYAGGTVFEADQIMICSGPDFESLYPEIYMASPLTRCKLQMMRTVPQDAGFSIGPSLCGGLTLTHYGAFRDCPTLGALKQRFETDYPDYLKWGIHVMVSQNGWNELVIGDSHEYGFTFDPFIRQDINQLILDYLGTFARIPNPAIGQTWHGIYVKMKEGTELVVHPEPGVTIVNGLGGAGMTLSFGLLEEVLQQL